MGVLTHRLHGSVTALAAMAVVSLSSEMSETSCLRSFFSATGQALLSSSQYAAASSFDFDSSLPNSMPMPSVACQQPPRCMSSNRIIPFSPLVSQSSALRFYKAEATISPGKICSQGVPRSFSGAFHSSRLVTPLPYRHSLLMLVDTRLARYNPSVSSLTHLRSIQWKYPLTAQSWRARTNAQHRADFPLSRLPQTFHFEKFFSYLYCAHALAPTGSAALLHTWHRPAKSTEPDDCEEQLVNHKSSVAVVLLGWLGAEHKHLKRYADWYTSRGIHAVTFVVPMKDLVTLKAGDKAEKHVDVLTENLVQWLKEDIDQGNEKIVIFHTFSNTGWLTYGAVLERFIIHGDGLLERIKGCVVDSAPSARPDPRVWASGFSAALLKKGSVATQMLQYCGADDWNEAVVSPKPSFKETALLAMLENFFSLFLQIPYVSRRLNEVVSVLANQQPACPQLYIYSSADIVIPATSVESFIEEQRKAGHMVKSCNFQCSPHVDHFRTFPEKYGDQLTSFLKLCVPQWAVQ